jgi:hypothetical protein
MQQYYMNNYIISCFHSIILLFAPLGHSKVTVVSIPLKLLQPTFATTGCGVAQPSPHCWAQAMGPPSTTASAAAAASTAPTPAPAAGQVRIGLMVRTPWPMQAAVVADAAEQQQPCGATLPPSSSFVFQFTNVPKVNSPILWLHHRAGSLLQHAVATFC